MTAVFAFEVTVVGTDWKQVVNAHTAGQAKHYYWRKVTDPWPDIPFTAIRARKLGAPQSTEQFKHTAKYRGLPEIECGQRVRVGESEGVIVGSNDSANFDVLFDTNSARYGGQRLNVHPREITLM